VCSHLILCFVCSRLILCFVCSCLIFDYKTNNNDDCRTALFYTSNMSDTSGTRGRLWTKEVAKHQCVLWCQELKNMKIRTMELKQQDPHGERLKDCEELIRCLLDEIQRLELVFGDQRLPLPDRPCGHRQGSAIRPCCC
jgi:hypothetical protein